MANTYKASNNATALTITSTINNSSDYTIKLSSGDAALFPAVNSGGGTSNEYTVVTLQDASGNKEIVHVVRNDQTGNMLIGVIGTNTGSFSGRAQENTTARTWAVGTLCSCRPTAAIFATAANAPATSQPLDTELTALATTTSAADKVPYYTGSGTASTADFTSAARTLNAAADAAAQRTAIGVAIGSDVQAYDAATVKSNATKVLTAGYAATPYDGGTQTTGTYTPDEANGNFQHYINNGAHTLALPANDSTIVLLIVNGASAGAITTSAFDKVTGVAPTTTAGHKFFAYLTKMHVGATTYSHLSWQALQ